METGEKKIISEISKLKDTLEVKFLEGRLRLEDLDPKLFSLAFAPPPPDQESQFPPLTGTGCLLAIAGLGGVFITYLYLRGREKTKSNISKIDSASSYSEAIKIPAQEGWLPGLPEEAQVNHISKQSGKDRLRVKSDIASEKLNQGLFGWLTKGKKERVEKSVQAQVESLSDPELQKLIEDAERAKSKRLWDVASTADVERSLRGVKDPKEARKVIYKALLAERKRRKENP